MIDVTMLKASDVLYPAVVSPGAKWERDEVIFLDDVHCSDEVDNSIRMDGLNEQQVDKLVQSLSQKIDFSEMPPVVRWNPRTYPNGKQYNYELVCGNHRFEALRRIGYDRWVFSVYKFALDGFSLEDSIRALQTIENDHNPALPSSENDLINIVCRLIDSGSSLVKNTEKSIRRYLESFAPNVHPGSKGRIVAQIVQQTGAYQDVSTYSSKNAEAWIATNTDYVGGGNHDLKRNKIGYTVKQGHEHEYILNAAQEYLKSDLESYFICHTKPPTKKMNLDMQRRLQLNKFSTVEEAILKSTDYYYKTGRWPWRVEGFLPQDNKKNEKKQGLIVVQ